MNVWFNVLLSRTFGVTMTAARDYSDCRGPPNGPAQINMARVCLFESLSGMSALGQKQTYAVQNVMSALGQ
jgi:hypothetical protein